VYNVDTFINLCAFVGFLTNNYHEHTFIHHAARKKNSNFVTGKDDNNQ